MPHKGAYQKLGQTFRNNPNRQYHAASAASHIGLWMVYFVIGLIALAALAIAIAALVMVQQHHNDRNKHTKSVGFSAFKNTTQYTIDGMAVAVAYWQAGWGYPSYDNTKGGFNRTSGIFTVNKEAIYTATATVCFATTNTTETHEVHLVTSGSADLVAVGTVFGNGTTGIDHCATVSQQQLLPKDSTVRVMAYTDAGNAVAITEGTLFSVERIAKFSA